MGKQRLEAFSDGVLAIIITIMVLELKVPESSDPAALKPLIPVFLSYILSFLYIGIYWNNHHHMLHSVQHVNGKVLWANMHLLFWLSLVPFATAWMGENHFETWPIALYGIMLLGAACAYYILAHSLIQLHGKNSELAIAFGRDEKGKISAVIYFFAIIFSFFYSPVSLALYAVVALIWIIPDSRIEKKIVEKNS
jgi:uncharacterized membrane protein